MKKLEKIKTNGNRSLYGQFLAMTLTPLILSGIIITIACAVTVYNNMFSEARNDITNVANSVLAAYDAMYDGSYDAALVDNQKVFYKGENTLSGNNELIDRIKEETGVEISLFFVDLRMLTTIKDASGNRMVDSAANNQIVEAVINNETPVFFNKVWIGGKNYCAYYEPVKDESGKVTAMIGTAKETAVIKDKILHSMGINICIMILCITITAFLIVRQASNIIHIIKKMMDYMRELAADKLNISMDPIVTYRQDELGEMGRLLIKLQVSLKKLIERDALTELYNRRSAQKRLDNIEDMGIKYSVAIGDIDFFKKFNDSFGHECGDVVLKFVANLLSDAMKGKGFVARWGGEEFLMVFEDRGIDDAYVILMQVRDRLHTETASYEGQEHGVTMTFGVEEKREDLEINKLINAADDKLYEGKKTGRDRVIK